METLNTISAPHQLVLFRGEATAKQLPAESRDLPVPFELISLFEAISGWVVEFQKTSTDACRGALGQTGNSPKGNFIIVDMSAAWPAQRPTASRIKCERFLKLLSDQVRQSQLMEDELHRLRLLSPAKSSLNSADSEDEEIHDSFEPRHPYLTQSELDSDFVISAELNSLDTQWPGLAQSNLRENKTESKLRTDTVETSMPVPQWQIGGRRGVQENRYIDWAIRKDHRIELIVGQIESPENFDQNQEWETKLTISPETSRFWFSVEPRGCYWLFDRATCRLNRITEFDKVSQLNPHQALVISTADLDIADACELHLENQANPSQSADDLASAIQDYLRTDEPLLVLLRQ